MSRKHKVSGRWTDAMVARFGCRVQDIDRRSTTLCSQTNECADNLRVEIDLLPSTIIARDVYVDCALDKS